MSERDEDQQHTKPSQAEGSEGEQEESDPQQQTRALGVNPSQAEGDRETVEEDLGER